MAHFRKARVKDPKTGVDRWVTPVAANGKGFLDLLMLRERQVVVELKAGTNKPSDDQKKWIAAWKRINAEVYVWYPEDWDDIVRVLD